MLYGNIKTPSITIAQPYLYTSREYDPEKGTYHYRARDYEAKIGLVLQKDPIGFEAGDMNVYRYVDSVGKPPAIEPNLYRYTGNNPVNYVDPMGLESEPDRKSGGYRFRKYTDDHKPDHWHVFKDGKELGRFDTENKCSMDKKMKVKGPLAKALRRTGLWGVAMTIDWSNVINSVGEAVGEVMASPVGGVSEAE